MNKYVTIGRLEVGISTPCSLEKLTYICGCRVINVGPFFALWRDSDCRCRACNQYTCKCPEDPYFCTLCENNPCDCTESGYEP